MSERARRRLRLRWERHHPDPTGEDVLGGDEVVLSFRWSMWVLFLWKVARARAVLDLVRRLELAEAVPGQAEIDRGRDDVASRPPLQPIATRLPVLASAP